MTRPLELLFVSSFPVSPATFGAQRRIEGLMRSLARRNRVSFVALAAPDVDLSRARAAMDGFCETVEFVPCAEATGRAKRLSQLLSLASPRSYERQYLNRPALQRALDRVLGSRAFDVVSIETPFLAFSRFDRAPAGSPVPSVLVDAHNVEFDLARQYGRMSKGAVRKVYHEVNWRKLRREELHAWATCHGVAFTSPDDETRARGIFPDIRSVVAPNGVDVDQFRPADVPGPGGDPTIVFFGTMNYYPNLDAVRWFFDEIWPALHERMPRLRVKIIGSHPPPDVLARRGPRVEISGLVDDLPSHLANATAIVVPLRIGGGTRLKILESLAMGKAIVSTSIGAEGIAARSGEHILLADDPPAFVSAIERVVQDRSLATGMGEAGRRLVEGTYSWPAIAGKLEAFLHELRPQPAAGAARAAS